MGVADAMYNPVRSTQSRPFVAAAICRHICCVYEGCFVPRQQRCAPTVEAASRPPWGAAYTQNTALYAATFRIRNPHGGVDAAATENTHAVLLSRGRCVYAMFMAADCRRYGWTQGRCFYMVFSAYTLRPWRQVAAATNERGDIASKRVYLTNTQRKRRP